MFGRDPTTPLDQMLLTPSRIEYLEEPDYKAQMLKNFQIAWTKAARNIELAQQTSIKYYKTRPQHFEVGDLVNVYIPVQKKGCTKKFTKRWQGPFRILVKENTTLTVQKVGSAKKVMQVHTNRCKGVTVPSLLPLQANKEPDTGTQSDRVKPKATDTSGVCRYPLRSRLAVKAMCLLILWVFACMPCAFSYYQCREFSQKPFFVAFPRQVKNLYFRGVAMKSAVRICTGSDTVETVYFNTFTEYEAGRYTYQLPDGTSGITDVWVVSQTKAPRIMVTPRRAVCFTPYTPCIRGFMTIRDQKQIKTKYLSSKRWYEYKGIPRRAEREQRVARCCAIVRRHDALGTTEECHRCAETTWWNTAANRTFFVPRVIKHGMKLPTTWRQINCSYKFRDETYNTTVVNKFYLTIPWRNSAAIEGGSSCYVYCFVLVLGITVYSVREIIMLIANEK